MPERMIPESQVAVYADADGRLHVSTLIRERNEARAENEALRAGLAEIREHASVVSAAIERMADDLLAAPTLDTVESFRWVNRAG
jgi:hypothetical protein